MVLRALQNISNSGNLVIKWEINDTETSCSIHLCCEGLHSRCQKRRAILIIWEVIYSWLVIVHHAIIITILHLIVRTCVVQGVIPAARADFSNFLHYCRLITSVMQQAGASIKQYIFTQIKKRMTFKFPAKAELTESTSILRAIIKILLPILWILLQETSWKHLLFNTCNDSIQIPFHYKI